MTLYMHTLDGKPASYYPKDGVCFASRKITLVKSLRQIRREQHRCKTMRTGHDNAFKYDYVTVRI